MADKPQVITVGHTESNEWGDLLVTPKGGGDVVKIKGKRSSLFPLFEQGKVIALDWQVFQGHPYVANAKFVSEGQVDMSHMEESAKAGEEAEKKEYPMLHQLSDKDKLILSQVVWKGNVELIKTDHFSKFYGDDAESMLYWQRDMAKKWAYGG